MPIYEYECAKCHQITEALQKFSDQPLTTCPQCGGGLTKLISMNSFQLKGGGWYVTDYAKKNKDTYHESKNKESSAPASEGSKSTGAPAANAASSSSKEPANSKA
ncbi:MAG: zinc ribbon domain-containing protein [Deltaproteobacteria bacterium]|jgi:putative FmdB family regulatory protein|nr:zinc ribbon domain-containing protein [Deltaproteobacteria bacterium]